MATFTNRATLSYNGRTTDSNTVTGTISQTLAVTKNAVIDEYSRGDNIVYVINLINSGATTYSELTLSDDLGGFEVSGDTVYPLAYVDGSAQYYSDGVLQPAPTVNGGTPLVISGITVPAGSNVTVIYIAEVTNVAPLTVGSTIDNTVTVSGPCLSDITATETVTVSASPELTITKALSPTTVSECSRVTYTFTITNSGNTAAVATTDVVLTDNFDPILSDITVTFEGEALSSPDDYTYNTQTGEFATVPGQITVPAATFTTNPDGTVTVIPSTVTLTVTGTI